MTLASTYVMRHEAGTASGHRNETQSVALNIRQDSSADHPADANAAGASRHDIRHGVDDHEEAAQHSSVLPGAASVRSASIFAIVAMIALFAILSLAHYPRALRVSSADIVFEQDAVALRVPLARTVAARLQVGDPLALEIPADSIRVDSTQTASTHAASRQAASTQAASMQAGSAKAACRIEGRVAGMPQPVGPAPASGPAIHRIRMTLEPSQRGYCRPLPATHYEARLDLGSDSYASMFAAALFRR